MIPSDRICYPFEETSKDTALVLAKAVQRLSVIIYKNSGTSAEYDHSDDYYFSDVWVKSYSRTAMVLGITAKSVGIEDASVSVDLTILDNRCITFQNFTASGCTVYVTLVLEKMYLNTLPTASVSLLEGDLVLRTELSHVSSRCPITLRSFKMSFSGTDTDPVEIVCNGDLRLVSGDNVFLSLSKSGEVSISSGPGIGAGASDNPPWVEESSTDPSVTPRKSMYIGVMSINGINDGGNVDIEFSDTAIQYGARILDGKGRILVGPTDK